MGGEDGIPWNSLLRLRNKVCKSVRTAKKEKEGK